MPHLSTRSPPPLARPTTSNAKQASVIGNNFGVVMWSAVEPNVGVISACLPSYRPIFKICVRSITTLKHSTLSTKLISRKAENSNSDHDFVRLLGSERQLGANRPIQLEELGVRTKIERDETKSGRESVVPLSAVHVRSDVTVQGGQD